MHDSLRLDNQQSEAGSAILPMMQSQLNDGPNALTTTDSVESFWDATYARNTMTSAATEPTAFIEPFLKAVGPVAGLQVLECGQGTGEITVGLARRGAHVTCFDVSPVACEQTEVRAALLGLSDRVTVLCASHQEVSDKLLGAKRFDVICGLFFLHHIDRRASSATAKRMVSAVWTATERFDYRLGRMLPSSLLKYGWWQLVECKELAVHLAAAGTPELAR
ncbi:MAG: class I SAM-dependent methyltransferase [Chloroflexi bacterium]|nr:class I SAM-dependent methyltransferase [Chloroflexota bacterium]